ncbi:acyl-CoA dehydrogenase family protein [Streptomyces sp. NPDC000678]|uniref:acyl-CoA dehydrogenase family protein n=1 Tax=Streptomyces sp. NPDC000678 TaxID=3154268 RepID=UPI00332D3948
MVTGDAVPHDRLDRALRLSRDRALSRTVQGQPPLTLQAIRHKLADMAAGLYAARSMTYDALASPDRKRTPAAASSPAWPPARRGRAHRPERRRLRLPRRRLAADRAIPHYGGRAG